MQHQQNKKSKKNTGTTWIIVLLTLIVLILIGIFFLKIDIVHNAAPQKTDNLPTSTPTSASVRSDESTADQSVYSVDFNRTLNCTGNYGTLKFLLVNSGVDGGIKLTYDSPNFGQTQSAVLVPTTIPTKQLKVCEKDLVKEVKINTELKLDGSVTKDFFYPFNGNDTRVYAYYMNNGHTALAFQPKSGFDQYQVIEFTEESSSSGSTNENSSSNNSLAPSYEEAKTVMQNKEQSSDIIYGDLGTSSDEKGAFRKLKATSISMRNGGGSGTLGFMKVYSDGTTDEATNGDVERSN